MKEKKRFFIIIMIFFCVLLISLIGLLCYYSNKSDNNDIQIVDENKTIKQIIEKHECIFIKEKINKNSDFLFEVNLKFKYNLYENDKSNEEFYNSLINDVAKYYNYKNFKLIDESRDEKIVIEVYANGQEIERVIINGIEDYFVYINSKNEITNYKEISKTNININSIELNNCINNNWDYNTDFGTRESIFQEYYIYFDEGIEVRTIGKKIYNIVFTKKYQNEVVGDIKVGDKFEKIKDFLGKPTFSNDSKSIIGYKSNEFYVFFENNQISIYRDDENIEYNNFFDLADRYINKEIEFKNFMNELTYIWSDYSEYKYDSNYVYISYPNKGVDIKVNYDDTNGIVLYNNIKFSLDDAKKYLKNTDFVACLGVDDVYNAEVNRVNKIEENNINSSNYDKIGDNQIYDYYANTDELDNIINMYFISKKEDAFNCELNETISSYGWLNDYVFIYSKVNTGIYYYDLENQIKGELVSGDETYNINSIVDGKLTYDNDKIINIR